MDRGAALVETALVMPLLVMLIVGGLDLGLATIERLELTHATGICANSLDESACNAHIGSLGGVVACWSNGEPPCYSDGLTGSRVTVTTQSVHNSMILPDLTLSASATGQIAPP